MIIYFSFKLYFTNDIGMAQASETTDTSVSQIVEKQYDNFLQEIGKKLSKIDANLAMQVMYYERKFPEVEPSVHLKIHYQDRTDMEKKRSKLNSRYGYLIALESRNGLKVAGLMDLKRIDEISSDPDIKAITGSASIAAY